MIAEVGTKVAVSAVCGAPYTTHVRGILMVGCVYVIYHGVPTFRYLLNVAVPEPAAVAVRVTVSQAGAVPEQV